MESVSLQDVIKQYITLPSSPTGTGWFPVLCKVCNDRGHKGPRAAFRFDEDKVAYHCFNCGHSTVYDPEKYSSMPVKMKQVLHDFNVPDEEWERVLFSALQNKDAGLTDSSQPQSTIKNIEPPGLDLPDIFYPLKGATDKWAEISRWYLAEHRGVDPDSYPFFLSKPSNDPSLHKWYGRLIIPIYKDNKLIFYQGRDLTGRARKKYESPSVSRDKVLYGFDKLFDNSELPLYIVEGFFDAIAIGGVAVMGNEISEAQMQWLNRSNRRKVYIPDQFGDGILGAKKALENGWHISTPDVGECKDISEAVKKYGKLFIMKTLADNTAIGFEAETKLGIFCKNKTK